MVSSYRSTFVLCIASYLYSISVCTPFNYVHGVIRRNAFDVAQPFGSPGQVLPSGVELEVGNPYLDAMHDPYDAKMGLGTDASTGGSPKFGGRFYFPTYQLVNPMGSISGSYIQSRTRKLFFGQQGGPLYPWMDPHFDDRVREINEAVDMDRKYANLPLPPQAPPPFS